MQLIDSHCHLDDPRFDADRKAVWRRANDAGVRAVIVPAISRQRWPRLKEVVEQTEGAYAAYGLHPMFLQEHEPTDLKALANWVQAEKAVAVGECGLDYYHPEHERQQYFFEAQVELAVQFNLPLIIHARKAVADAIAILRNHPGSRGVFHSYSGSYEQAKLLLDMGFCFGIGGPYTWEGARKRQAVLQKLPLDSLLLETDAPDQPDQTHRGQRNEPAFIIDIASSVAKQRNLDLETLVETVTSNTKRLFFS